jgi:probable rRNA maturation factor
MIEIELSNQQSQYSIDAPRLTSAARRVLEQEGVRRGSLSIAVVDDPTIHELNRRYLQHDHATDVLSFLLDQRPGQLDGEVIVSADTAAASCRGYGWSLADELLLYVVHGVLHLVGYDDSSPQERQAMRQRERHHLGQLGLTPRYDEADDGAEEGGECGPGRADGSQEAVS